MVEVLGMMMEEKEYEFMMSALKAMWEAEEDKDYYDDFDEFVELKIHQFIYPEVWKTSFFYIKKIFKKVLTILTKYVIIRMVEEDHSCINYTAPPAFIHCPGNVYFMQNQDSLYITRNKIDDPLSPIAFIQL